MPPPTIATRGGPVSRTRGRRRRRRATTRSSSSVRRRLAAREHPRARRKRRQLAVTLAPPARRRARAIHAPSQLDHDAPPRPRRPRRRLPPPRGARHPRRPLRVVLARRRSTRRTRSSALPPQGATPSDAGYGSSWRRAACASPFDADDPSAVGVANGRNQLYLRTFQGARRARRTRGRASRRSRCR